MDSKITAGFNEAWRKPGNKNQHKSAVGSYVIRQWTWQSPVWGSQLLSLKFWNITSYKLLKIENKITVNGIKSREGFKH